MAIKTFKEIGIEKVVVELINFKKLLDKKSIKLYLICGVLLGAIREKELLLHDKDIDLGISPEVNLEELKNYLNANGYDSHYGEDIPMGKFLWAKKYVDNNVIVFEILPLYKYNGQIVRNRLMGESFKEKWKQGNICFPSDLIDKAKEIKFHGENFLIPNPPEEYLTLMFGKNWCKKEEYVDWRYHAPLLKPNWVGVE